MKIIYYQSLIEVKRTFRNFSYIFWSILTPITFYILYTKVFFINLPDQKLWQAYFLMSMTSFSIMGGAIVNFGARLVAERQFGWSKQMSVTPVANSQLFFSKIIGQSTVHLLVIIIIFLTGFIVNGVKLSPVQWLTSGLWILLGTIPFLALGTVIGTINKVDTASGIGNLLYISLAILGGMWTPLQFMPDPIQKIGEWMPSFHYGNGAWQIIQGHSPELENVLFLTAYFILFMLLSSYRRKQQLVIN